MEWFGRDPGSCILAYHGSIDLMSSGEARHEARKGKRLTSSARQDASLRPSHDGQLRCKGMAASGHVEP